MRDGPLFCRLFGHKVGPVPYEPGLRRSLAAGFPYPDWWAGLTDTACQRCTRWHYKRGRLIGRMESE